MSRLEAIFDRKREEVAIAKLTTTLFELKGMAGDRPATLGFADRLAQSPHRVSLIAEVKAKSPSAGTIRIDFQPDAIAKSYFAAGAECLSVLTDRDFFGGDPAYIDMCKSASGLPVLRKDFIDDPYQVWEARSWGADAILLIVAALEVTQIIELSALAKSIGLDVLVEVHTETEAEIAIECNCAFVGVNNRDLSTFQTNLAVSELLLPMLAGRQLVSESAISEPDDVERVASAGARSVLIGTAFCGVADIEGEVGRVMCR